MIWNLALGGWKSYEMVLRYAHLAPEHLSTAAQGESNGLGVSWTVALRFPYARNKKGLRVNVSL